jgi:hypothetical protein
VHRVEERMFLTTQPRESPGPNDGAASLSCIPQLPHPPGCAVLRAPLLPSSPWPFHPLAGAVSNLKVSASTMDM